jgi:hypothetical protein
MKNTLGPLDQSAICLDIQYKNSSYAFSIVKKIAVICEFQHIPLYKMMLSSRFHTSHGMRFCRHVPNSSRNKNVKRLYLASKTLLSSLGTGKMNFFLQL